MSNHTPTVEELGAELARTRRQVRELTRRFDQLSRVLRMHASLTVDSLLEPPAPDFDEAD